MKRFFFKAMAQSVAVGVFAIPATLLLADEFKLHRQNGMNSLDKTTSQPKTFNGAGGSFRQQPRNQVPSQNNSSPRGNTSQANTDINRIKVPNNQNLIGNGAGQAAGDSAPRFTIKPDTKFVTPKRDLKKEIGGIQGPPRQILLGPNRPAGSLTNPVLDLNKDLQKRLKDELTKTPIRPIGPIQIPNGNNNGGQGEGNGGGGGNQGNPPNDDPNQGNGMGNGGMGNGGNGNGGNGNGNGNDPNNQPPAENPPQQNPPQDQNPPGVGPQPEWWLQLLPWLLQQQGQNVPQPIVVQPQVIVEAIPDNTIPAAPEAAEQQANVAQVVNGESLTLFTNQTGTTPGHAVMEVQGRMLRLEIKTWNEDSVSVVLPQLLTNTKLPATIFLANTKGEVLNAFELEILPRNAK